MPLRSLLVLTAAIGVLVTVADVPPAENALVVEERYRKLGGTIEVIREPGKGHHPHGLANPRPVVDFILAHAAPEANLRP